MNLTTRVEFTSDWHLGAGSGVPGSVDRSIRRDQDGLPFVPAKTVTGNIRSAAETIATGLGGAWPQLFETVFGTAGGNDGLVNFRPLRLEPDVRDALNQVPLLRQHFLFDRYSVTIDATGQAEEKKLYLTELGRRATVFIGTGGVHNDISDHGLALLLKAAETVRRIGGGRRRGLGRCEIELELDGTRAIDVDVLLRDERPSQPPPAKNSPATASHREENRLGGDYVRVPVEISLETPVIALDRTIGNVRTSHTFIPGTMLLGPLVDAAGGWDDLGPAVFNGDVRVLNAYPTSGDQRLRPSPHSLFRNKRAGKLEPYHNALAPGPRPEGKPQRNKFLSAAQSGVVVEEQCLVHYTHAVIDPVVQRPSSAVGGVYTYRALPRGTVLRTAMTLPRGSAARLDGVTIPLRIGASKKDDYGAASARFGSPLDPTPSRGTETLTVWLTSDTIILDRHLQPDPTADGVRNVLERELGVELKLETAYIRAVRREGWSKASNLPRHTQNCVEGGAVMKFRIHEGGVEPATLEELERVGIGERTAEGFGEIVFNPRFLDEGVLQPVSTDRADADCSPAAAPTSGTDGIRFPDRLQPLVAVAVEDAAREIAPSTAEALAAYLKLRSPGPDQKRLGRTQLGSLRDAVASWRTEPTALQVWIETVEQNAGRKSRWQTVLGRLQPTNEDPAITGDPAAWFTAAPTRAKPRVPLDGAARALLEPVFALAERDGSGAATRRAASVLLTAALRYALTIPGGE